MEQYIVEANIDDFNPELYQYVEEKLFNAGALDVYKTSIVMKKSRLSTKLSVLVETEKLESIEQIIFKETPTLGLRTYPITKKMLKREFETVQTEFGKVNVKKGILNGKVIKVKAEYEDCKRIALEKNIEISQIYRLVEEKIKY